MSQSPEIISQQSAADPEWVSLVRKKVEELQFGIVQIVVHDGRVTQIDWTEKTRLISTDRKNSPP